MRRVFGALLVAVFGLGIPSVGIWLLGAPWWTWSAILGGGAVVALIISIFVHFAAKYPGEATIIFFVSVWAIFLTPFATGVWWAGLALLGGLVGLVVVGSIAWYGLMMMLGRD